MPSRSSRRRASFARAQVQAENHGVDVVDTPDNFLDADDTESVVVADPVDNSDDVIEVQGTRRTRADISLSPATGIHTDFGAFTGSFVDHGFGTTGIFGHHGFTGSFFDHGFTGTTGSFVDHHHEHGFTGSFTGTTGSFVDNHHEHGTTGSFTGTTGSFIDHHHEHGFTGSFTGTTGSFVDHEYSATGTTGSFIDHEYSATGTTGSFIDHHHEHGFTGSFTGTTGSFVDHEYSATGTTGSFIDHEYSATGTTGSFIDHHHEHGATGTSHDHEHDDKDEKKHEHRAKLGPGPADINLGLGSLTTGFGQGYTGLTDTGLPLALPGQGIVPGAAVVETTTVIGQPLHAGQGYTGLTDTGLPLMLPGQGAVPLSAASVAVSSQPAPVYPQQHQVVVNTAHPHGAGTVAEQYLGPATVPAGGDPFAPVPQGGVAVPHAGEQTATQYYQSVVPHAGDVVAPVFGATVNHLTVPVSVHTEVKEDKKQDKEDEQDNEDDDKPKETIASLANTTAPKYVAGNLVPGVAAFLPVAGGSPVVRRKSIGGVPIHFPQ